MTPLPTNNNPADKPVNNGFAAIMTMMLPGIGQMLKGQIMPGIFWAFATGFGYFSFFWPGLAIHTLCIFDAAFNKGEAPFKTWFGKISFATLIVVLIAYIYFRNF